MAFSLQDRIVLVTGSGRGIGAAIGRRLAEAGGMVYLADLELERTKAVAAEIRANGGQATALMLDVTQPESWAETINTIQRQSTHLDVLVNNVGITVAKSIEDTSLEEWRLMMTANLDGPFIGLKAALPLMRESAKRTPFGGSIINTCSVSGIVGTPNLAGYTATKGGLRYFSKSAALEFARAGYRLRVNTVHPGLVQGPTADILFQSSVDAGQFETIEESAAFWTARYPVNRMARPSDIAGGVLFLASDESNYMTGAELIIDGGLSAQ